jgi:HEAT repeat protein
VKALGKIRDGTAVEPLIAILRNNDGRVCREAVDALDAIHDIRAVEPLIAVIADKGGSVCDNTVEALGNFGDERAVEPLVAVLTETRYSVMEALVKIGKPSVEPLIKALKSNNDFRRWDAAHVLIRLYHQGILDEEAKKRILSVRDVIYRPHTDYPETCSGPHSDVPEISL